MFCRVCYYDLRGQEAPRCPECGTDFEFTSPETFLDSPPSGLRRVLHRVLRPRRTLICLIIAAWAFTVFGVVPRVHSRCRGPVVSSVLQSANPRQAMVEWLIQLHGSRDDAPFNRDLAARQMRAGFSGWSEVQDFTSRLKVRSLFTTLPYAAVPTMAAALLLSALTDGRRRRVTLLVLVVASFLWVLSAFGDSITETVFPGSHSFLDDYVYLPGIKAREELYAGEAVAAYARRASGGTRLIAFSYGGTRELAETETKKLFESQGIPYPEPLSVEGGQ